MRVRLEQGRRPIRVKARRYPPAQRKFLEKYIDTLYEMDFFQEMPTAAWKSASLQRGTEGGEEQVQNGH